MTRSNASEAATLRRLVPGYGVPRRSQSVAREIVQWIVDQDLAPGSVVPSADEHARRVPDRPRFAARGAVPARGAGLTAIKPGPGAGPVVGGLPQQALWPDVHHVLSARRCRLRRPTRDPGRARADELQDPDTMHPGTGARVHVTDQNAYLHHAASVVVPLPRIIVPATGRPLLGEGNRALAASSVASPDRRSPAAGRTAHRAASRATRW